MNEREAGELAADFLIANPKLLAVLRQIREKNEKQVASLELRGQISQPEHEALFAHGLLEEYRVPVLMDSLSDAPRPGAFLFSRLTARGLDILEWADREGH